MTLFPYTTLFRSLVAPETVATPTSREWRSLSLTLARSQLPVHRAPDAGYKKGTRALLRTPHHTLPSHSLPRYPPPLCPRQEGGSIAAVASARGGRACHARQLPRSTTTTRPRWPFPLSSLPSPTLPRASISPAAVSPVQVAARSPPEQLRSVTDEHLPAANLDVPEPRNSASRLRQASAAVRHLSTVPGSPR